jgi:hypothetical protein
VTSIPTRIASRVSKPHRAVYCFPKLLRGAQSSSRASEPDGERHHAPCICHRRPIDRSSNGYTNARRNGRIAAMYALPNRPFGFTSTAIRAW